jgi:hypothetical protein
MFNTTFQGNHFDQGGAIATLLLLIVATLAVPYDASSAATASGIPCGVCHEMAGDPRATAFLIGAGVRALSMSAGYERFYAALQVVLLTGSPSACYGSSRPLGQARSARQSSLSDRPLRARAARL